MSNKFYGIDIHKKYATISVLNDIGEEIEYINKCTDLEGYIKKTGEGDHTAIEACTGSFYWADKIETYLAGKPLRKKIDSVFCCFTVIRVFFFVQPQEGIFFWKICRELQIFY